MLDERTNVRFSEQLAARRADARDRLVGFKQHGARGAEVGVQPVVPLLLVLEVLGGDVRRGRGLAGFWRKFLEALRRSGEAGRQLGDRALQCERERVAFARRACRPASSIVLSLSAVSVAVSVARV